MNMNREQITLAVEAGLELLSPESDIKIPAKLNDGIFFLKGLLAGVAQGKISLSAAIQQEPPKPPKPPKPPTKPPVGKKKGRRKARSNK